MTPPGLSVPVCKIGMRVNQGRPFCGLTRPWWSVDQVGGSAVKAGAGSAGHAGRSPGSGPAVGRPFHCSHWPFGVQCGVGMQRGEALVGAGQDLQSDETGRRNTYLAPDKFMSKNF